MGAKTGKTHRGNWLLSLLSLVVIITATFVTTYVFGRTSTSPFGVRAAGNEWYVSTGGNSSNNGTKTNPWDLQTALNQPASVKPGDTIWVMEGRYTGSYHSRLHGVAGSPITVRAYPGARATIDTAGVNIWMNNTTYTNFWGLEITQSTGGRDRTGDQSDDYTAGLWASSGAVKSHHVNFINMILHDVQFSTFGWYTTQTDSEMYGSLIYQNGSTRKDHGLYVKNSGVQKRIIDNIIIDNASHGIHAYSEKSTTEHALDNIYIEGNIIAQNGSIGFDERNNTYGRLSRNILVGGTTAVTAKNTIVKNNFTYHPSTSTGASLNIGYDGGSSNTTISGNYLAGGYFQIGGPKSGLNISNNTIYYSSVSGISTSAYPSNTWTQSKPAGLKKVVRLNKYEPGRANIAIYNWGKSSTVTLSASDLSGLNLKSGNNYELRNAQNYYGDIIRGTYNGNSIVIPMTGRSVATPRGIAYRPPSTFPEFGAFVLINMSTSSTNPIVTPTPSRTPTPTVIVPTPTRMPPTPVPTRIPSPTPAPTIRTMVPNADAYVSQTSSSTNYGLASTLGVDADPGTKRAYIKFDVSLLYGKTVLSANFRIKTLSGTSAVSGNTMSIRSLANPSSSWSENTITFNQSPALGTTTYATFVPSTPSTWYTMDVTSLVRSRNGNFVTIGINSTGTDGADFYSRETSDKPQLVVTYR